jgi:hypothetical protein
MTKWVQASAQAGRAPDPGRFPMTQVCDVETTIGAALCSS